MELNIQNLSKKDSDKLIKEGIAMPITATTSTISDVSVITGNLNGDNEFPVVFQYYNVTNKMTVSGKDIPTGQSPLIGHAMYGKTNQAGEMHLDSISGTLKDTSLRTELKNAFNNMVGELRLPEKKVKIGDTLYLEVPYNHPIGGVDTHFIIKATYKLTSIRKGLALFDISQSVQLDMNNVNGASTYIGKGIGSGKMVYSIKENFFRSIDREISFDYQMEYKGKTMKGEAKINSSYFFSVK
jgi:hypothetical protein